MNHTKSYYARLWNEVKRIERNAESLKIPVKFIRIPNDVHNQVRIQGNIYAKQYGSIHFESYEDYNLYNLMFTSIEKIRKLPANKPIKFYVGNNELGVGGSNE